MSTLHPEPINVRITELEIEHRDLDHVIQSLIKTGVADPLQLRRLKKRKLQIKDYITLLKMQLTPPDAPSDPKPH